MSDKKEIGENRTNLDRPTEPDMTPPKDNRAAWVEKYVDWATYVLAERASRENNE